MSCTRPVYCVRVPSGRRRVRARAWSIRIGESTFIRFGRALDHGVRSADDVLRRAEVLHEIALLRLVVGLEATDELDARLAEAVDVLVVVAHGHDA